jgi:hypothetical protein
MINVTDNYKLVNMEIEGEESVQRLDEKPWNVVEVEFEGVITVLQEGNQIQFIIESNDQVIIGTLEKISGKKEKMSFQINPLRGDCRQIWDVTKIKEGTLKVITNENTENDETEDEE